MTAEPDEDDALSWAGDEPARVEPSSRVEPPAAVEPPAVVELVETPRRDIPAPLLITYGILIGAYFISTVGWVIVVQRLNALRGDGVPELLANAMFLLGEGLAIASPALWLAAAFLLTRGRKPIVRLVWILLGLVVVIPWPFVLGVWA
jgi:hypothetical protein